ncbi:MAG: hypothetical protein RR342_01760 [Bacilli bacterium]
MNDVENPILKDSSETVDVSKDVSLSSLYAKPKFSNKTNLLHKKTKHMFSKRYLSIIVIFDAVLLVASIVSFILAFIPSYDKADTYKIIMGSLFLALFLSLNVYIYVNKYSADKKSISKDTLLVNFFEESLVSEVYAAGNLLSTYTIHYNTIEKIEIEKEFVNITYLNNKKLTLEIAGFDSKSNLQEMIEIFSSYKNK